MMNRLLIRCSACFLTSAVTQCRMLPLEQKFSPGLWYSKHVWHWPRSSILKTSCRSKSPICRVAIAYKAVVDFLCLLLWRILDEIIDQSRLVWGLQDLFRQTGNEKCFWFFLQVGLECASQLCRLESPPARSKWSFPSEENFTFKMTTLSSALVGMLSYKIIASLLLWWC